MISQIARLTAAPGKATELRVLVEKLVADVNANEPGTLHYIAHVSPEAPDTFVFFEQYTDDGARDAHRTSEHFRAAARAIRDQGLLVAPPAIEALDYLAG